MADNTYDWATGTGALAGSTNKVVGQSQFGQNENNGNRMQPDAYYSDLFLERKRFKSEELVFANFAQSKEIKKGLDTLNLRRYEPLKAHIVPLIEGQPPIGDRAHGKAIIAKTRQYGRFMEFTDQFEYKVADPVIEEYTMELADVANETIDMLAQAALLAEAQTFFPTSAALTLGAAVPTSKATLANVAAHKNNKHLAHPSFEDLRIIKLTMEAAKVKPINGVYIVLASPAVYFDLQSDVDDKTLARYMAYGQTNAPMVNDDIPVMYGIRVMKAHTAHTEAATSAEVTGSADPADDHAATTVQIHHTIMLGAKAYSKVTISGSGGIEWFRKALGSAGTLDPLNQRQTIGWKMSNIGFKVTDPDAVVDYMSVPSQADIVFDNFDYVTEKASEIGITDAMATAYDATVATAASVTKISGSALDGVNEASKTPMTTVTLKKVTGVDPQFAKQDAAATVKSAAKVASKDKSEAADKAA